MINYIRNTLKKFIIYIYISIKCCHYIVKYSNIYYSIKLLYKNPRIEDVFAGNKREALSAKPSGKEGKWKDHGEIKGVMVARYRMSDCCRRAAEKGIPKRGTAKLRKNCDAHTYKRRPVNSMDPLPPRRARFQSVSSLPFLFPFSFKAIRGAYKAPRPYVCMSQGACTCASTGADFCMKANEMARKLRQHNFEAKLEFPSLSASGK